MLIHLRLDYVDKSIGRKRRPKVAEPAEEKQLRNSWEKKKRETAGPAHHPAWDWPKGPPIVAKIGLSEGLPVQSHHEAPLAIPFGCLRQRENHASTLKAHQCRKSIIFPAQIAVEERIKNRGECLSRVRLFSSLNKQPLQGRKRASSGAKRMVPGSSNADFSSTSSSPFIRRTSVSGPGSQTTAQIRSPQPRPPAQDLRHNLGPRTQDLSPASLPPVHLSLCPSEPYTCGACSQFQFYSSLLEPVQSHALSLLLFPSSLFSDNENSLASPPPRSPPPAAPEEKWKPPPTQDPANSALQLPDKERQALAERLLRLACAEPALLPALSGPEFQKLAQSLVDSGARHGAYALADALGNLSALALQQLPRMYNQAKVKVTCALGAARGIGVTCHAHPGGGHVLSAHRVETGRLRSYVLAVREPGASEPVQLWVQNVLSEFVAPETRAAYVSDSAVAPGLGKSGLSLRCAGQRALQARGMPEVAELLATCVDLVGSCSAEVGSRSAGAAPCLDPPADAVCGAKVNPLGSRSADFGNRSADFGNPSAAPAPPCWHSPADALLAAHEWQERGNLGSRSAGAEERREGGNLGSRSAGTPRGSYSAGATALAGGHLGGRSAGSDSAGATAHERQEGGNLGSRSAGKLAGSSSAGAEERREGGNPGSRSAGAAEGGAQLNRALLGNLAALLAPVKQAVAELGAEGRPTLQLVLPTYVRLEKLFTSKAGDAGVVSKLCHLFLEALKENFKLHPAHKAAMFLDPRQKLRPAPTYQHDEIVANVCQLLELADEPDLEPGAAKKMRPAGDVAPPGAEEAEVYAYLREANAAAPTDLFQYWAGASHPRLARLALWLLAVPAVGARVGGARFCEEAQGMRRRRGLGAEEANKLLFLRANAL
ncbi:finger 618 isoform X4 [Podarcis lilfordi]|uniref:Finger 618 isoform X4 n=1 Tax=Podarcis lilfordi TaxID=74358 RepID=A0AA35LDU5_9SAUR|nr:finger 618 isoform X4 [Podarcis lilfordi]